METSGHDCPEPIKLFADIDFGAAINRNIQRCKFKNPTPVQKYAIPISLKRRDLMACAQTGSGKTAAFCFPIIHGIIDRGLQAPRGGRKTFPIALVSHRRELAIQIHEESPFALSDGRASPWCTEARPPRKVREMERGAIRHRHPGRLDRPGGLREDFERIQYLAQRGG